MAKLGLTLYGIDFGMFFVEGHMLAGLDLLETAGATAELARHHARFLGGLFGQLGTFAAIVLVAVFKPAFGKPARRDRGAAGAVRSRVAAMSSAVGSGGA